MTEGVVGTIGSTALKDPAQEMGAKWIRFLAFTEKQRRIDEGQPLLTTRKKTT